jgi:uncharacterized alkaline shock family protein YloU
MEGQASVAADVLASYAAAAAREVEGVERLLDGRLPRQGAVRIAEEDGLVQVELHLRLRWAASAAEVGADVQRRVADYLERMVGARPDRVDVVVDEIGPPA